jgi:hypothetical protein
MIRMKQLNLLTMSLLFFVQGCASFVKDSRHLVKNHKVKSPERKISFKVVLKTGKNKHIIKTSDELIKELSKNDGCDLSRTGMIMQKMAITNTAYGYRIVCEVFASLKKQGNAYKVVKEDQSDFHIEFNVVENASSFNKVWQTLNFISLALIPYWGKRSYTTKVINKKVDSVTEINNEILDVRQTLLIFVMPFVNNPNSANSSVHTKIAKEVYNNI